MGKYNFVGKRCKFKLDHLGLVGLEVCELHFGLQAVMRSKVDLDKCFPLRVSRDRYEFN